MLGGNLVQYRRHDDAALQEVSRVDFGEVLSRNLPEIQSVALSADGRFACVSTNDAPLYSLFILHLGGTETTEVMKIIEQRSLLSVLEYEAFQDVCTNTCLTTAANEKKDQKNTENMEMTEEIDS